MIRFFNVLVRRGIGVFLLICCSNQIPARLKLFGLAEQQGGQQGGMDQVSAVTHTLIPMAYTEMGT